MEAMRIKAEGIATERPVFVADHPWRRRGASAAIGLAGVLLLAWLVAIVGGALGFGGLPTLPFTGGGPGSTVAPGSRGDARQGFATPATTSSGRTASTQSPAAAKGTAAARAAAQPSRRTEGHAGGTSHGTGSRGLPTHQHLSGSTGRGATATSPASGAGSGEPSGIGTETPTRGGGGSSGSAPLAGSRPAPTTTPSGNEVPSGSASGPSGKAAPAGEVEPGKERGGGAPTPA
jgi:hypothetical protein